MSFRPSALTLKDRGSTMALAYLSSKELRKLGLENYFGIAFYRIVYFNNIISLPLSKVSRFHFSVLYFKYLICSSVRFLMYVSSSFWSFLTFVSFF